MEDHQTFDLSKILVSTEPVYRKVVGDLFGLLKPIGENRHYADLHVEFVSSAQLTEEARLAAIAAEEARIQGLITSASASAAAQATVETGALYLEAIAEVDPEALQKAGEVGNTAVGTIQSAQDTMDAAQRKMARAQRKLDAATLLGFKAKA